MIDFGISRLLGRGRGGASDGAAAASVVTRAGVAGTPAYMAPEQLSGTPPDPRSDQFSFAVTLYEALYGVRPVRTTARDSVRVPANSHVPRSLWAPLKKALAIWRAERHDSMVELLAALREAVRPLSWVAHPLPQLFGLYALVRGPLLVRLLVFSLWYLFGSNVSRLFPLADVTTARMLGIMFGLFVHGLLIVSIGARTTWIRGALIAYACMHVALAALKRDEVSLFGHGTFALFVLMAVFLDSAAPWWKGRDPF